MELLMSKFVIRTGTGKFVKGGRKSHYSPLSFVESIQDARIYDRRADAVNSINAHFTHHLGFEVVPVVVSQPVIVLKGF
jgi:hypothetical protein